MKFENWGLQNLRGGARQNNTKGAAINEDCRAFCLSVEN
jgi:hypothetical protein